MEVIKEMRDERRVGELAKEVRKVKRKAPSRLVSLLDDGMPKKRAGFQVWFFLSLAP